MSKKKQKIKKRNETKRKETKIIGKETKENRMKTQMGKYKEKQENRLFRRKRTCNFKKKRRRAKQSSKTQSANAPLLLRPTKRRRRRFLLLYILNNNDPPNHLHKRYLHRPPANLKPFSLVRFVTTAEKKKKKERKKPNKYKS